MTDTEYRLTCLIEECAEVQQRATKALRFGLDEIQPGQPLDNRERLAQEVTDLMAVLHDLRAFGCNLIGHMSTYDEANAEAMNAKLLKLRKYMAYSRTLGIVE